MLFVSVLLGWIIGITTLGMILPDTLFVPRPLVWMFAFVYLVLRSLQFLGSLTVSSQGLTQTVTRFLNQFDHVTARSLLACCLGLSSFYLAQAYAQQQLQQRLQQRITTVSEQEYLVYVHTLNQSNALQPDRPVQQQVEVLGDWQTERGNTQQGNTQQGDMLTVQRLEQDALGKLLLLLPPQHTDKALQLGGYYRVRGEVKPAHSYAVAGVFDQEKLYLQQNLIGSMWVRQFAAVSESAIDPIRFEQQLKQQQSIWHHLKIKAEQSRQTMRELIYQAPLQNKGLLLGLLTGDDSFLSSETKQQFKALGISHLLAISGPHVLVFAAMFCCLLTILLNRLMPRVWLVIPRPYLLVIPFTGCVLIYSAFSGLEIPALRTALTVLLISGLILLKQRVQAWKVLLTSAALLLWLDPFSILSAAFWLSYGACFILIRVYQTLARENTELIIATWGQRFRQACRLLFSSQWKIFIALFPLTLLIFQQVSWIAPLVNLIAIPIIGAVVVPLEVLAWMLSTITPMSLFLLQLADFCLSMLLLILSTLQQLFGAKLSWIALTPMMIMLLAIATLILFLPRGILPKSWAILCCCPLLFGGLTQDPVELEVIDVGQGQAIYLRSGTWRMLLDTGGTHQEQQFGIGEQVLIPHLMSKAIGQLDLVILSHLDQDHAGAFNSLATHLNIGKVMSNQRDERFEALNFQYCAQGQQVDQSGVSIKILSPSAAHLQGQERVLHDQNEASCVVYIQIPFASGWQNFLVMGDAGWETEYRLLQHYPDLKVDVLVLGHHGSRHSSSYAFLKHYQPQLAIASAGFNNRYQHPHPLVITRLKQLGIPLKTTIDSGSLQFTVSANGNMQFHEYRQHRQWLQRQTLQD